MNYFLKLMDTKTDGMDLKATIAKLKAAPTPVKHIIEMLTNGGSLWRSIADEAGVCGVHFTVFSPIDEEQYLQLPYEMVYEVEEENIDTLTDEDIALVTPIKRNSLISHPGLLHFAMKSKHRTRYPMVSEVIPLGYEFIACYETPVPYLVRGGGYVKDRRETREAFMRTIENMVDDGVYDVIPPGILLRISQLVYNSGYTSRYRIEPEGYDRGLSGNATWVNEESGFIYNKNVGFYKNKEEAAGLMKTRRTIIANKKPGTATYKRSVDRFFNKKRSWGSLNSHLKVQKPLYDMGAVLLDVASNKTPVLYKKLLLFSWHSYIRTSYSGATSGLDRRSDNVADAFIALSDKCSSFNDAILLLEELGITKTAGRRIRPLVRKYFKMLEEEGLLELSDSWSFIDCAPYVQLLFKLKQLYLPEWKFSDAALDAALEQEGLKVLSPW